MLTAAARLRRSDEFAATIKGGRRASRGGVVVHLRTRTTEDTVMTQDPARPSPARAGFVVSKAVGDAVVRNKVRRRLRHLVREQLSALPATTDVVVRALPSAAQRTFDELRADLESALAAATTPRRRSSNRESG